MYVIVKPTLAGYGKIVAFIKDASTLSLSREYRLVELKGHYAHKLGGDIAYGTYFRHNHEHGHTEAHHQEALITDTSGT